MAKGYWIAHVTVSDPDQYKHYADAAPEAFKKYNARMLARGGQHSQMEGVGKARNVAMWSLSSTAIRMRSTVSTVTNIRRPAQSAWVRVRPILSLLKVSNRPSERHGLS